MWVPVAAISAVFALPIIVDLVLHWPGQFGNYLAYVSSRKRGGHSLAAAVRYALWYWRPQGYAWAVPIAGYTAAAAISRWLAPVQLRRFLVALLAVDAVSTLAFLYYAMIGIDKISRHYMDISTGRPRSSCFSSSCWAWSRHCRRRWVPLLPPARWCSRSPPSRWHRKRKPARAAAIRPFHQRPGHRPRAARCRRHACRARRSPDDRPPVQLPLLARRHRLPGPGRAHRGAGMRGGPQVGARGDQPVHLHAVRYRTWPALLAQPSRPARPHGHRPAPPGRGDRRPGWLAGTRKKIASPRRPCWCAQR